MLNQLYIQLKTSTLPGTSYSNQSSSWTAETPKNTRELEKQTKLIKNLTIIYTQFS